LLEGDMAIIVRLDRMLADRKMTSLELSEHIGITPVNLSRLKTGKVRGVRFSTLDAICKTLKCQPADILEYAPSDEEDKKES
jgi:putative transcriptional regulator